MLYCLYFKLFVLYLHIDNNDLDLTYNEQLFKFLCRTKENKEKV